MSKKCLINVEGGLGKHVMLTAILEELKAKGDYDELYVISPYFDVFKACSVVTDAFPPGQASLYQELVLDEDCDVLWKEPYSNQKFIKKQCHLFDAWAEEFGFELTDKAESYTPRLDNIEKEFPHLRKLANDAMNQWKHNFCLVQFTGGQSPLNPIKNEKGELLPYMNAQEAIKRNYYKGQAIIDRLHEKYPDTTVVHFALANEPGFDNTVRIEVPYLTYHLLAAEAKEIVCIDSSLQHLSTGANNNITVIWGETRPEHFGYSCNNNICAQNVRNSQPYFKPLGVSPSIVKMPEPEEVVKIENEQQELGL